METPPYLFDQFAKTKGVSTTMAKRALCMQGYAAQGKSFADTLPLLGISKSSAQDLARRFMIDFPDYRPYAGIERKGGDRPGPKCLDVHQPVSGLPLFA